MAESQKTLLEVLTKALKDGRDLRSTDRQGLDVAVNDAIYYEDRQNLAQLLDHASRRNMLVRDKVENRYGEEIPVELSEVKPKEPYEKRPCVRALRQARSKEGGLGR